MLHNINRYLRKKRSKGKILKLYLRSAKFNSVSRFLTADLFRDVTLLWDIMKTPDVHASQTHWTTEPPVPRSIAGRAHIKRSWLRRKIHLIFIPFGFTFCQKGTSLSAVNMAQKQ